MFKKGAIAKVWKVQEMGSFTKANLSTDRKKKDSEEWERDFSGWIVFAGEARNKIASLEEGVRIKLGDIAVSTKYDKEKEKEYINYYVFDFDVVTAVKDGTGAKEVKKSESTTPKKKVKKMVEVEVDDDDEALPF